jgi:hypothetical protein
MGLKRSFVRLHRMSPSDPTSLKDALTIVGGALGAIAFLWRIWDTIASHLRVELEVKQEPNRKCRIATALVTVENQGLTPKRFHYAALLIGIGAPTVAELSAKIASGIGAPGSNDGKPHGLRRIFQISPSEPIYANAGEFAIVPLPFLYQDQMQIGNERIRQRVVLASERLQADKHYTVLLVVIVKHSFGILRWRTTSDLLIRAINPSHHSVDADTNRD